MAYKGTTEDLWLSEGTVEEQNAAALEKLRAYKDAGMTVYMPQMSATYDVYNDVWETCDTKRVLDLCEQVGLKVIIIDGFLWDQSTSTSSLIGNGATWATMETLTARVKQVMSAYVDHPAFYGVMLADEPSYTQATAYGEIYRAIKGAYPDVYVQYNLLPMTKNLGSKYGADVPALGNGNLTEAQRESYFRAYLETFIDATGADYVMYDQYPLNDGNIYETYIAGLQVAAELCKEKGIELRVVAQTMKLSTSSSTGRNLDEQDLYWLNNMLAGFGVKGITYFTYQTKENNADETFYDGYSFVNSDGTKTSVYYSMQKIMAELQRLAPVILPYDYNASAVYKGTCSNSNNHLDHVAGVENATFAKISSVSVDKECALITELKNDVGAYTYMVQNVVDPDDSCGGSQTVTLTFAKAGTKITVYRRGEASEVVLSGNTYSVTQAAGEAVYIVVQN